jgi:hypothetical protein
MPHQRPGVAGRMTGESDASSRPPLPAPNSGKSLKSADAPAAPIDLDQYTNDSLQ